MSSKKQNKENYIKYFCKICGYETTNFGLGMHIFRSHKNISYKEYYDKYIDISNHICQCGKQLKWIGLMIGYSKTCGDKKCINFLAYCNRTKSYKEKTGYDNPFKNPECKEKIKKTYKEKTGYDHNSLNPECRKKRIKTCIEKYGYDNPAKSDIIKEKIKKRCIQKYGVECHLQNSNVIKKRKNTCIERYKVDNVRKSKKIKDKIKLVKLEKYGDENYNNIEKIKQTNLIKYGSEFRKFSKEERKLGNIAKKNKAFIRFMNSDRFKNKVTPKFDISSYKGVYNGNTFECNKCHIEFIDNMKSGKIPRCPKCYPIEDTGKSIGEKEVSFFIENYTKVENNKRFYENNKYKYEIDIFLPLYNIGIEYNGVMHHSEIFGGKDRKYHFDKTEYFEKLGIQIIHIYDFEWYEKEDLIKSMLLSKIHMNQNIIYARKCEIKYIDKNIANEFIENNHLQGKCLSSIQIGLYYLNELVSVLTINKSRFNKKYDFELIRFCNKQNTTIVGGFNKFISFFKKTYQGSIISYVNRRISNGEIYKKNGFTYIGKTPPNYFYIKKGHLENRINYQKHKLSKKLKIFDSNLSEWQNMQLNNFDRIWDCGNLSYLLK